MPATLGVLHVRLPHEGQKSTESDVTDWTPGPWRTGLCAQGYTIRGVVAAQAIGQQQPQHWSAEVGLRFTDADAAAAFVDGYTAYAQRCDGTPVGTNVRVQVRVHDGVPSGTGYGSLVSIGHFNEQKGASGWTPGRSGGVVMLAREGAVVVASIVGGEYGGEPVTAMPEENARMGADLAGVRGAVCAASGTC